MAIAPGDNLFTVIAQALVDSDCEEAYLTAGMKLAIAGLESPEVDSVLSRAAEVAQTPYAFFVLHKHYAECSLRAKDAPPMLCEDTQSILLAYSNQPVKFEVKRTSVIGTLRVLFTRLDPVLYELDEMDRERRVAHKQVQQSLSKLQGSVAALRQGSKG